MAAPWLIRFAKVLLIPFMSSEQLKLIIVMIATPMIMNSFQFYVVDLFIEGRPARRARLSATQKSSLVTPFLGVSPSGRFGEVQNTHSYFSNGQISSDELPLFLVDSISMDYYGLSTFTKEELATYAERISDGEAFVAPARIEKALTVQRQLVNVFNEYIDLRREGKLDLKLFKQVCEENDNVSELFGIDPRQRRMSMITDVWRNHVRDPNPNINYVDFKHVHVCVRTIFNEDALEQQLAKFSDSRHVRDCGGKDLA